MGLKVTVAALDAYGNVVTGYRGKVRLTSTDPRGGKADYTFTAKDNGVATLSYTFATPGLQTLQVADTGDGSILGKAQVNVLPKA